MYVIKSLFKERYRIVRRSDGVYELRYKFFLMPWDCLAVFRDYEGVKNLYEVYLATTRERKEKEKLKRKCKVIEESAV